MIEMKDRLIGALPSIGIRPVVDGRTGGARENYEASTMALAHAVARLFEAKLRYACGIPVKTVVADTCIGGVAEAQMCADQFSRRNVGVSLTISRSWCYGAETMDMDPLVPKAIWGTSGSDVGGAVFLASVLAAHDQKGLPAFMIYGREIQDKEDVSIPPDVEETLLLFARAGLAVAYMRGKSYLGVGGVSMGIAGSMVDAGFFQNYLGMRNECVDMTEFARRIDMRIYDESEYTQALAWTRKYCREGADDNPPDRQLSRVCMDAAWETSVKMALIMRDLMVGNPKLKEMGCSEEALGHNALAGGFQGQRHWTDHFPTSEYMEAILNSSFDWTGIRQPYIVATENDSLNGVSMLFGAMVTHSAQIFADIRTYWSPESIYKATGMRPEGMIAGGMIHLINSGPAALDGTGEQINGGLPAIKPFYDITEEEMIKCLNAVEWRPADSLSYRAGGFSSDWLTRGDMPVTLVRLNLHKRLGPCLQIAEGHAVSIPPEMHHILDMRTNPTWPSTWFVPKLDGSGAFRSVYSVMAKWGANHGSFSYGHIGPELIALAAMLRIPVSMHNVAEERIFRPTAWDAYGTKDLEGADFRACKDFGSLYA